MPVKRALTGSRRTTSGGHVPDSAILRVAKLEQIQFLLGHVSIQKTSERHLGCKQRIHAAVNDRIGIEPGGT